MFSGHVLCIYTFALYISIYSVLALLKIVFVYLACVCASLKCMQLQVNCKWCINKSMYGRVETNKALDCYSCQCNLRLQVNKHLYTIQKCPNVLPMCIWAWILDDRSWTLYICACTCPWSPSASTHMSIFHYDQNILRIGSINQHKYYEDNWKKMKETLV